MKGLQRMALPAISLFSGAGGLDLGVEQAGFTTRVCVERDPDAVATLKANRPRRACRTFAVIARDIADAPTDEILRRGRLEEGEAALLVGGPPCQAFSKSGNWTLKPKNGGLPKVRGIRDPEARKALDSFVRVLREARPKAFLMENVHGLAYSVNKDALELVLDGIPEEYEYTYNVLNAADYGVPQIRERLFVVGWRTEGDFQFPAPTHACPEEAKLLGLRPHRTAEEAIGDLDDARDVPEESELVGGLYRDLLPGIPEGDNYLAYTKERGHPRPRFKWRSRYWSFLLKLARGRPSWTIQAQQGSYTGPFHWRNRKLRMSERARLQTFPDDYVFCGEQTSILRQVGNAVPCDLAAVLAASMREQLFPESARKKRARPVAATSRAGERASYPRAR